MKNNEKKKKKKTTEGKQLPGLKENTTRKIDDSDKYFVWFTIGVSTKVRDLKEEIRDDPLPTTNREKKALHQSRKEVHYHVTVDDQKKEIRRGKRG